MGTKWAVVHEYDLNQGLCFMAKKDAGRGEVALFDSRREAEEWAQSGEDLDADLWQLNYIEVEI